MLVKCVCSNCGHSYLADDQAGKLDCPRCGVDNEGSRNPSDIPDAPYSDPVGTPDDAQDRAPDGAPAGGYEQYPVDEHGYDEHGYDEYGYDEPRFDPKTPPAMYLTADRFLKGLAFGGLAALLMGGVLGAALGAIRVSLPAIVGLLLALVGGAACRYGFRGRISSQTRGRALTVILLMLMFGFVGYFTGSWTVERFIGLRTDQTRADLDRGLRDLKRQRARSHDAGEKIVLERKIEEVQTLQDLSDARLEDYLWKQQAQLSVAPLAYAKLKATRGPVIRLPKARPISLPPVGTIAIFVTEFLVAAFVALRGVTPRAGGR